MPQSERLFDSPDHAVCAVEFDGSIRSASIGFHRRLGIGRGDVSPLGYLELFHPDDRQQVSEKLDELGSGATSVRFSARVAQPDGSFRWSEWIGFRSRLGPAVCALVRDVSGQRSIHEELLNGSVPLHAIVDDLDDGLFVIDRDWRFAYLNPAAERLVFREPGTLRGTCLWEEFPAVAGTPFLDAYERGMNAGEAGHFDARFAPLDRWYRGDVFPIDDGIAVLFRDATSEHEREVRLRTLAAAVEHGSSSVIVTDPDGTIQLVNSRFEEITGYSRREVVGRNPRILKSGEHDEDFYEELWKTIERGEVWRGTLVNRRKDGSTYEEETTIAPVRDSSGEIVNYVAAKRDVSRELELEREIRHLQHLDGLGRFAGGIAHDFKNLLTVVLGFTDLLLEREDLDAHVREDVEQIGAAAHKATGLTRQLLAFAGNAPPRSQPIDIERLVHECLKPFERLAGDDVSIAVASAGDLPAVVADSSQIEHVLLNLLLNAVDAMPDGGRIEVTIREISLGAADVLAGFDDAASTEGDEEMYLQPGRHVLLAVRDDGHGMDEETMKRIFDPFFTTKEQGSGLGLSMVYGVIRDHGGHVRARSRPGEGTTFEIYLPATEVEAVEPKAPPTSDENLRGRETILVVNRDVGVRAMICRALEQFGYRVQETGRSEVALQIVRDDAENPDLLITEAMTDQPPGSPLAEAWSASRPDAGIVYLSRDETDAVKQGAAGHPTTTVAMPFRARSLVRAVRQLLDDAGPGGLADGPPGSGTPAQ